MNIRTRVYIIWRGSISSLKSDCASSGQLWTAHWFWSEALVPVATYLWVDVRAIPYRYKYCTRTRTLNHSSCNSIQDSHCSTIHEHYYIPQMRLKCKEYTYIHTYVPYEYYMNWATISDFALYYVLLLGSHVVVTSVLNLLYFSSWS